MINDWMTGYCTNVHPGTDVPQMQSSLEQIAVVVREQRDLETMGVGLWIPQQAASQLETAHDRHAFSAWLSDRGLVPFTINGFPFGNFHQPVVKHRVYEPTWWDVERRDYTLQLAEILNDILPRDRNGSISTLPLGWAEPAPTNEQMQRAAVHLKTLASRLGELEQESGRRIVLAIEPEPGCWLDTTDDMLGFFDEYLSDPVSRRYLTVCHDICHSAVMYEEQVDVLTRYRDAGIGIGKVQVSSAIEVRWGAIAKGERMQTHRQLTQFAEDRYLHQTVVMQRDGQTRFVEDLPQLLHVDPMEIDDQSWRIHFHVPIYLQSFGNLHTTRDAVQQCIAALGSITGLDFSGHLEAETYAWGVLPKELSVDNLSDGIANELRWLQELLEIKN